MKITAEMSPTHFVCKFKRSDGTEGTVSGGLSSIDCRSIADVRTKLNRGKLTVFLYDLWVCNFRLKKARDAGMPEDAEILSFKFA